MIGITVAKDEPLLKDLYVQDEYNIVSPEMLMPKAAAMFAENPGDVLLVYEDKNDHFLGCLYLHDFHLAYANPPNKIKKIHLAAIGDVANTKIEEIEWSANVTQAWALVTTKKPHGIILRDEKNRFAGFLSNEDLMSVKKKLDQDAE
jgi:CBS domain containing-hemolysin-like protein